MTRRAALRAGLLLAAAVPLLAACGGASSAGSPGATAGASATTATGAVVAKASPAAAVPTGKGATLTFWIWGGKPQADLLEQKVFPGLYTTHTDVKRVRVQILSSVQDLYQKLVTSLAGNAAPDIARIKDYWTAEFGVKGVLLPLDSYLATQKNITSSHYGAPRWNSSQWKGKTYSLPFTTFVEDYYFNKTLMDAAGVKPASTWAEQTDNAKKLTDASKQQWGYMLYDYGASQSGTWDYIPLLWQAGGEFTNKARTKLTFNSDAGVQALAYQVDLIWKYKVALPPGASTTNVVENNKIGQWHTGCWVIASYAQTAPKLQYGSALVPALRGDNRSMIIGGNNVGGFKQGKHPQQVWEALAWLQRDEIDLLWNSQAGYLPVRTVNWTKSPYTDNPNWQVVVEQAKRKDTRPIPIFVGYEEVTDKIGSELQAAYFKKKSPKQALADAESEGNALIAKYQQG